ncbi:bZIP transcription factor 53 [Elaeis guineensis]|uniref:BZIP transcription factor 53 n=1 Tax=Elaeis guineensis var. tenera TaxID=51953 RepID=A0A6I9QKT3_ELAGV|nr:bZIP transcription factor 53 [Elaeis guineensis]
MSSLPAHQSFESKGNPQLVMDERKRKRMLSNRESARRSRMKKQHHLDDLINQAAQLRNENEHIVMQANLITQRYTELETENSVLRAQVMELTERLQSLNSVLHIFEEVSGMAMDIPEIPDPLLRPWQLPCPAQPIMATADMFQF